MRHSRLGLALLGPGRSVVGDQARTLNRCPTCPTPCQAPIRDVGVQGVAESAAFHVAGGRLPVPELTRGKVTVAESAPR
jgi:cobalamin synthesis CbiG-like protein